MRLPIPNNKLVAFTLAGALLTAVVAGALAFPVAGVTAPADNGDTSGAATGTAQAAADAPTPNQNFTPAVQSGGGSGGGEYEDDEHEAEEHEAEEHEAEEYEEDGE